MVPNKRVFDRKVLYPGDVLIREGDHGECAFYIQGGQLGVYRRVGDEEVLITVLPGNSVVGEMALIDNARRSATVRCLETATVVSITRPVFERKLQRLDPFVKALLEMFSQKIRRLNDDYCEIEKKLQWLLTRTGLPRPATATRWVKPAADLLGTPASAASAALADMMQAGLPEAAASSEETEAEPAARSAAPAMAPSAMAPTIAPAEPRAATVSAGTGGRNDGARTAVHELSHERLGRFDRLTLELAMLYHPDCTGSRSTDLMTRADVFREIWDVLQKINRDYHPQPPAAARTPPPS